MITIEEKIKLFTKIVYDRVERENKITIDKFNEEFLHLLEDKKREFILEADENFKKSKREVEKEGLQLVSKARVEAKKLILAEEKNLIDETIRVLLKNAEDFTTSLEYEEYFRKLLFSVFDEIKDAEEITIVLTKKDSEKFNELVQEKFAGISLEIERDDSIIGGAIVINMKKRLRIDMSIASKILGASDIIGQKIADMFN